MTYTVTRVITWEEVEEAAAITKRCISPGDNEGKVSGPNWEKAKKRRNHGFSGRHHKLHPMP